MLNGAMGLFHDMLSTLLWHVSPYTRNSIEPKRAMTTMQEYKAFQVAFVALHSTHVMLLIQVVGKS